MPRTQRRRPLPQTKLDPAEIARDVCALADIPGGDWDLLLIGDGSGLRIEDPCGFACVSVERAANVARVWAGGFNRGSVNFAEACAYLAPLDYFARTAKPGRVTRTYVVTDSQHTANLFQDGARKPITPGVWSAFQAYARLGFVLNARWLRRELASANRIADRLSRTARLAAATLALVDADGAPA